jgi:hypothetical protein
MAAAVFAASPARSAAQIPTVKDLKKKVKDLPSLASLRERKPALTTSLADAVWDVPALDGFEPASFMPMSSLDYSADRGFALRPGLFEMDAVSYCLKPGTYGPGGGDGYAFAPLVGPEAGTIRTVLRNSVLYPDVKRTDVQLLLWAIIARAKYDNLSPRVRAAADILLSREQVLSMNRSAVDLVPESVLREASRKLTPEVRDVFIAEAKLRGLLTEGTASYEEVEAVAVLTGATEPGEGSRPIPPSRWSYHPDGYFLRFSPTLHSRTRIELHVPEPMTVTRDTLGRVLSIDDLKGNRIVTSYDDSSDPIGLGEDPGTRAFRFSEIRFVQQIIVPPEIVWSRAAAWKDKGWTLNGVPEGQVVSRDAVGGLPGFEGRLARTRELLDETQQLAEESARGGAAGPRVGASLEQVVSLAEWADGVRSAVEGSGANRVPWADEHVGQASQAWQDALCGFLGGCRRSNGPVPGGPGLMPAGEPLTPALRAAEVGDGGSASQASAAFDPASTAAMPGDTRKQRLGMSGRKASDEECAAARKSADAARRTKKAYEDESTIAKAEEAGMSGNEFENEVLASAFGPGTGVGDSNTKSPMGTDPTTCIIHVNWNREEYRKRGYPDIEYDADFEHESTHSNRCKSFGNPLIYNARMSVPRRRSEEESAAYGRQIEVLEEWIAQRCGGP